MRDRFRQESITAARLAHPNVVATYDTGEDDDGVWVVTELVRGDTLASRLAGGPLPVAEAAMITDQIAAAMEHAHRSGLARADLSADDVVLCQPGAECQVKVGDFALARPGDGNGRAIVGILGGLLYEMLCGRPPATDAGGETVRPRKLRAGIPKPLETLVLRALSSDPRQRFNSPFEFRRALSAVDLAPDDAVPAWEPHPTPPGGGRPFARRPRRSFVPLAVFVALAGATLAAVAWLLGQDTGDGERTLAGAGAPVDITAVRSFDPEADGQEHESTVRRVIDRNPATTWTTERYRTARFSGTKSGLGLILQLDGARRLERLEVDSPTAGWAATVYVADSPAPQLSGWGRPVDRRQGLRGRAIFNLQSQRGGAVLLWVTDPGSSNQLVINEITLSA